MCQFFIKIAVLASIQSNFLFATPVKSAHDIQQSGNPLLVVRVTAEEARMVSKRYYFNQAVKDSDVYDTIIIEDFRTPFLGPFIILCNSEPKADGKSWPRLAEIRRDKIMDTIIALSKATIVQAGSSLEGGNAKGSNAVEMEKGSNKKDEGTLN